MERSTDRVRRYAVRAIGTIIAATALSAAFAIAAPAANAAAVKNGKIAFVRQGEIWTMHADGSGQRQVTSIGYAHNPAWSPDGTKIAFLRYPSAPGAGYEIWIVGPRGHHLMLVTTGVAYDGGPTWSPDGQWIAFSGASARGPAGIFKIRAVPPFGDPIRLTPYVDLFPYSGIGSWISPDWSPDGSTIAITHFISTGDDELSVDCYLDLVNSDGTDPRETQIGSGWDLAPSWGPKGKIAVSIGHWDGPRNIFSVRADGTDLTALTDYARDSDIIAAAPDWSPDGKFVLYSVTSTPVSGPITSDVYLVDIHGVGVPLMIAEDASDPSWQPVASGRR